MTFSSGLIEPSDGDIPALLIDEIDSMVSAHAGWDKVESFTDDGADFHVYHCNGAGPTDFEFYLILRRVGTDGQIRVMACEEYDDQTKEAKRIVPRGDTDQGTDASYPWVDETGNAAWAGMNGTPSAPVSDLATDIRGDGDITGNPILLEQQIWEADDTDGVFYYFFLANRYFIFATRRENANSNFAMYCGEFESLVFEPQEGHEYPLVVRPLLDNLGTAPDRGIFSRHPHRDLGSAAQTATVSTRRGNFQSNSLDRWTSHRNTQMGSFTDPFYRNTALASRVLMTNTNTGTFGAAYLDFPRFGNIRGLLYDLLWFRINTSVIPATFGDEVLINGNRYVLIRVGTNNSLAVRKEAT